MSLRFIYGRAGSGKSHYCLNDIKSKLNKKEDAPLILLIPEQFSLQAERNVIKEIGFDGAARIDVLSFKRMTHRVFNQVGGITQQHINPAGKCMLLYFIINKVKDQLKVFSKAATHVGFIDTICKTISELKRYNVNAELLEQAQKNIKEDELLNHKINDISIIFHEFEKVLHEKYIDSDDDLTLLSEKLDISTQFDGAEIWMDEFSGFTPQQYKVIKKLLEKAERINISLSTDCLVDYTYEDNTEVFSPSKNTVKNLLNIARENNIEIEKPVILNKRPYYRFKNSKELEHLEQNYFSFPHNIYTKPTKDISMFSSVNIYSEVEHTARDIIRLCREEGLRYKEIAVVTRNLEGYEKLVKVIFNQYKIPYFIDQKRDINNHPIVLLILSALDIFINNWSYQSIFGYLKTGLTNIDKSDIDLIENYVLATGIRGTMWTKDQDWTFNFNYIFDADGNTEHEQNIIDKVNEIKKEIISPLMNFRSKVKNKTTTKQWCTALYEFLCEINLPDRIEERIQQLQDDTIMDVAMEYQQIWNIIMNVLDQAVEVAAQENINTSQFRQLLAIGFNGYKIGVIPPALDQVIVGSIERSRNSEVKSLYIIGVNDGIFPAVAMDEGILSDSDRGSLNKMGIELSQDTRTQAFEEQYLIYTALTTASKFLTISYPIANHEGSAMRPSTIIQRLKNIFPAIKESSNIIEKSTESNDIQLISTPAPTFTQLITAVRKHVEGVELLPLWKDVYNWYINNKEWEEKCNTALLALEYSNQVQYIKREKIKKLYGNNIYSSISKMEKFVSCPFSYYIQYGLKAKKRKVFKLEAPDIGTFIHNVLDTFSKQIEEENISWRQLEYEKCKRDVSNIVDDMSEKISRSLPSGAGQYKYILARLKRTLTRAIWLIATHIKQSGFQPLGYETSFGDKGDFPPINIELASGETIKLIGRIDRVDTMETDEGTYLRIIDYKSGSKKFQLDDAYYGLQIQLITYLSAILEEGRKDIKMPILPGGILYFKIDDPIIKAGPQATEEVIEQEIMKKLKMNGLLLADVKLIKEMDNEIEGHSLIIPARINKNDTIGSGSSAATMEQFQALQKHIKNLLTKLGEEILKGNISISPYKKGDFVSCTYCEYKSICQFDRGMKDNTYRIFDKLNDKEVWGRI